MGEYYKVSIESMPVDYIGIVVNVIPIIIAIISIIIAVISLMGQKKHNVNSVKPIIDILLGDYENDIYVKIMNNGVGPAIIDKLICEYEGTMELSERQTFALIELLKDSKATSSVIETYESFVEDISGRTIPPRDEIVLVRFTNGSDSNNTALRLLLKDVTISVHYRDVYDNGFDKNRKLDYFNRTLNI